MGNILVVESENDKFFIEAIIKQLNLSHQVTVENWEICIDEYACLEGTGNLEATLKTLKNKISKTEPEKVGIILDQDKASTEERLQLVNDTVQKVFCSTDVFQKTCSFITLQADENCSFELACYFIHLNGTGEVENLLKTIKTADSPHADCLSENWINCLTKKETSFSDKELLKEWVRFYIRYDTCDKKRRKQAARKCDMTAALKRTDIWDFEHHCLNELKEFLSLFQ